MTNQIAIEEHTLNPKNENTVIDVEVPKSKELKPATPNVSRGDKIIRALDNRREKALGLLNGDDTRFEKLKTGFMLTLIKSGCDQKCTIESIAEAFFICCQYNLDPSSGLGKIYLVPYKDKLQAQIGYLGWLELIMRRTDIVSYVDSKLVFEDDYFDFEIGNETWFKFKPNLNPLPLNERKLKLAYAMVKFKNGDIKLEIATLQDIVLAKSRSSNAYKWVDKWVENDQAEEKPVVNKPKKILKKEKVDNESSIWYQHFNEMAKVVALRKFRTLALSIIQHDENNYLNQEDEELQGYSIKDVSQENVVRE